jgi:hypothetical protein
MSLSWIDKLEQRVGLKPKDPEPLSDEDMDAVVQLSSGSMDVISGLRQTLPDLFADPKVAAAAAEVERGHREIMALFKQERREAQMKTRSTDVSDR